MAPNQVKHGSLGCFIPSARAAVQKKQNKNKARQTFWTDVCRGTACVLSSRGREQAVCSPASRFSQFETPRQRAVRRTDMPERGVFAGLCNCAGLIGAERERFFIWVRWRKGGWRDVARRERRGGGSIIQGVHRRAVIKRLQETARAAHGGAIKARREWRVNY